MSASAARLGMCLLFSALAVAAIAGGLALSRRTQAQQLHDACWGASAG